MRRAAAVGAAVLDAGGVTVAWSVCGVLQIVVVGILCCCGMHGSVYQAREVGCG